MQAAGRPAMVSLISRKEKLMGKQRSFFADALLFLSLVGLLRQMSSCGINLGIKLKRVHFL